MMYEAFLTFIKDQQLIRKDERVLVALSGGVDSMVLAALLQKAGYDWVAAHMNYQLRGSDSDQDEQLVRSWCESQGVPVHVHRVDPETYASSGSIQMVARDERYAFFDRLCDTFGYEKVATAHHANDNLETVLLNLTKGTGIRGLTGIAEKKGRKIRPLLFATKLEIYDWARSENIPWREDLSNAGNDYERNLIRNEVVPILKQINPALEHTFRDTLSRIKGAASIFAEEVQNGQRQMTSEQNHLILNVAGFTSSDRELVLLSEVLKPFGFSFREVTDLAAAIGSGHSGKLFYSATHQINLDRQQLILSVLHPVQSEPIQLHEANEEVKRGGQTIRLSSITGNEWPTHDPGKVAFVDMAKVSFPLTVRSWQEGDYFYPLGMRGKKKVSDLMIDLKIPVTLKSQVPIVESAGEVVWIVGHRLDDRYKVTAQTTAMLKIELIGDV